MLKSGHGGIFVSRLWKLNFGSMGLIKHNCVTVTLNCVMIWGEVCLFKLNPVPETKVTIFGETSAILRPEDCRGGDFIISQPVYVCFNSSIDYAICKLNYE